MSTRENPRPEYPSTYLVQDRSNEEDLNRLLVQDRMLTASMGGVLAEQPDPASRKRLRWRRRDQRWLDDGGTLDDEAASEGGVGDGSPLRFFRHLHHIGAPQRRSSLQWPVPT